MSISPAGPAPLSSSTSQTPGTEGTPRGGVSSGDSNSTAKSLDSAVDVTITPEAEARLERVKAEQAAADRLIRILNSDASNEAKQLELEKPTATSDVNEDSDGSPVEESIDEIATIDDFFSDQGIPGMAEARESLIVNSVKAGNPEAAQGLREALDNGTVQVRKADDVPGANFKTTVTYTASGEMSTNKSFNPSAEIQAELDNGKAATMWNINHGDVYITW